MQPRSTRARVTKQSENGSYEVVSSQDTYVTGEYKSVDDLLNNHHVPWHWSPTNVRFELFYSDDRQNPSQVSASEESDGTFESQYFIEGFPLLAVAYRKV